MKIIENINNEYFPDIKIIKYSHFNDNRGYFTEHYRNSDMINICNFNIKQCNQSFSYKNVCRGLHFQWNNYMGKLVRVISGSIIDLFLDIRQGSTTFGYIGAYKLIHNLNIGEWIYIPEGFAHGFISLEDSVVEYLCNAEYSGSANEACIYIFDPIIKWNYVNKDLIEMIKEITPKLIMSERDMKGLTLNEWTNTNNIEKFRYNNNNILVTGGSGLLGKTLQNKLNT